MITRVAVVALTALVLAPLSAQQPATVSLIINNGIVITVDGNRRVLNPGAIAINGNAIVAVDTPSAVASRYKATQTIDATGQVVMPGLINTHTHAAMVLFRGLGSDMNLMDWLNKVIFPAEAKTLTADFVRIGTELALLEMIQSGTTYFSDMYYFMDTVGRAARAAGVRAMVGQTVIDFPTPDANTHEEAIQRTVALAKEFAGDELITPSIAPHAVYTVSAAHLESVSRTARQLKIPIQIHLSETNDELRQSAEQHQARPVAVLDRLNFWAPITVAAHGVWVNDSEIALLKSRNVGIAHNPESNMKLSSGTAPVVSYRRAGVNVGIGTDGAASNNDLDMFEAMRQAAFQAKLVTGDPTAVSAVEAIEMATIGGARVVGQQDRIGSLEAGKRADLIIVDMSRPRQTPLYDPVAQVVFATNGNDVVTTIVNGTILMRDRKVLTMDEGTVLAAARGAVATVRKAIAP
ncbi:MAG: amidohydrolase family protein [Acidimicrobiia bacterium]|nr:amidohydrolase family protein [Acidimicrobiia bacterium]